MKNSLGMKSYSMIQRVLLSNRIEPMMIVFPLAIVLFSGAMFSACSKQPQTIRAVDVNPLIAEGKLDEAVAEITRTLAEFPNNTDLLFNLATLQHLQGKPDAAQKTLAKALTILPNDDEMNFLMVELLISTAHIQDAWDRFQMLSDAYRKRFHSQYTLGIIYSLMKNWPNAEGCFRAAIELGDPSAAAKAALAFVACIQGRLDEGKAYLVEAETNPNQTPEDRNQIAECYLLLEQTQRARDLARKLTEQSSQDARYWSLLGRAEMKLLNFGDSESAFTRAMACPNSTPWIQVHYAEMLYASHREEEALIQATDAEERCKKLNVPILIPSLYNLLATLYAKSGQIQLSQRYLTLSYQLDPSQSRIQDLLKKITNSQQPESQPESHPETISDVTPSVP